MPHTITEQPHQLQTISSNCPHFHEFHDSRNRGCCLSFDKVTRKHHRRTLDCDHAIEQLERTKTFKVELISEEIEDDGNGYPVPVECQIIEVTVADSHPSSIVQAVSAKLRASGNENLKGYRLVRFWQPVEESEF